MAHERKRLREKDSLREEEIISDFFSDNLSDGPDRADQYLPYSLLRKIVKWTKKVALWLINCALFNSFLVYTNLSPGSKLKYKEFLVQAAKARATNEMEAAQTQSDTYSMRPGP
jgi:hypothetical protein